jgi:hypothetical protein
MTTQKPNQERKQPSSSRYFGSTGTFGQKEDGGDQPTQQDKPAAVKEMQHRAQETMETVGEETKSRLEKRKETTAHQVNVIAEALRASSDELREQEEPEMAKYASMAADRVDRLANTLRYKSVDQLTGEVENFARRKPEVFLGAAFVAGVVLARFLKSSGQRSREREHGDSSYWPQNEEWMRESSQYETGYEQPYPHRPETE